MKLRPPKRTHARANLGLGVINSRIWTTFLALLLISAPGLIASDWPQFLGPSRNGIYPGKDLAASWPKEGPPVVWQKKIGQGFAGPAVSAGKLILFHRLGDKETVECLDSKTGNSIWTADYPTKYRDDFGFDEGPRATPAIAGDRVYTFGAEGMLHCLDLQKGTILWSKNVKADFRAGKGFFGIACSPLVEGNAVMLNSGGRDGAGIIALDRTDGKLLWKATNDEASYSSPSAATIDGRRYAFALTRGNLVALNPADGSIFFQYPFRPPINSSVTAATPLVIGDLVFLSASYDTGAVLLKIKDGAPEKLWSSEDSLSNHYATCVHHKGFLYGIHGRTDPGFEPPASLRCIELATGKVRWQQENFGAAVLTLAGDDLLILTERGELIRARASPVSFKSSERVQVLSSQVRAHPAIAAGLFYARSKDKIVCVDLTKGP